MKNYIKNIPCVECGKIGVKAKKMCHACYSKAYRNTPEGKEKAKIYRKTLGKLATERYLDKIKPNRVKRSDKPVQYCECGQKTRAKGMCASCYQKQYQKNRAIEKSANDPNRKPYKPKGKWSEQDIDEQFKIILSRVKKGVMLSNAYKGLKIDRSTFVRRVSSEKMGELIAYKDQKKKLKFFESGFLINEEEL